MTNSLQRREQVHLVFLGNYGDNCLHPFISRKAQHAVALKISNRYHVLVNPGSSS